MKRILTLLAILGLSLTRLNAQGLTLDSCYAMALQNYPLIRQYELIEKTMEYTLSNASKAYLPQLNLTAIGGLLFNSGQRDTKLIGVAQLNQPLWDGGATKTQKEIISASAAAEKANLDVSLYDLRKRVNQLYFGILLNSEQLAQLDQHQKVLQNNADRIRQLNANGMAYQTDLDEIKVEQLKLEQQKTAYTYTQQGYLDILSLLIGQRISESSALQKPNYFLPDAEISIARPELALFNSQRTLIDAQAGMRQVSYLPKVGLMGIGVMMEPEVSLGPASLSSLGVLGLSASWNISGLYKNNNEKNLTQLSMNQIDLQEENFRFNNTLQSTQAKAQINKNEAILSKDGEIVALRKSIRQGYQVKYNNGMCSMLDLLDATEKESEALSQQALHQMQLLMSQYEYKTITGN